MNLPPLEQACTRCKGRAVEDDRDQDCIVACPDCNGSGFRPTRIGLQILTLVQHNARMTVNAEWRVAGVAS